MKRREDYVGCNLIGRTFLYRKGKIAALLPAGTPVPGDPLGQFPPMLFSNQIDDQDHVLFQTSTGTDVVGLYGVFLVQDGSVTRVASVNERIPGRENEFLSYGDWVTTLNASGKILIDAPVCCGGHNEGIFIAVP